MLAELPPLPTGVNGGKPVLRAYTGSLPGNTTQTNGIKNGENAELYAVFPYRVYGLDKANLILATNTYNKRLFKGLGWADWIIDQSRQGRPVWCYFNNDIHGHAIHDAQTLKSMVRQMRR